MLWHCERCGREEARSEDDKAELLSRAPVPLAELRERPMRIRPRRWASGRLRQPALCALPLEAAAAADSARLPTGKQRHPRSDGLQRPRGER